MKINIGPISRKNLKQISETHSEKLCESNVDRDPQDNKNRYIGSLFLSDKYHRLSIIEIFCPPLYCE